MSLVVKTEDSALKSLDSLLETVKKTVLQEDEKIFSETEEMISKISKEIFANHEEVRNALHVSAYHLFMAKVHLRTPNDFLYWKDLAVGGINNARVKYVQNGPLSKVYESFSQAISSKDLPKAQSLHNEHSINPDLAFTRTNQNVLGKALNNEDGAAVEWLISIKADPNFTILFGSHEMQMKKRKDTLSGAYWDWHVPPPIFWAILNNEYVTEKKLTFNKHLWSLLKGADPLAREGDKWFLHYIGTPWTIINPHQLNLILKNVILPNDFKDVVDASSLPKGAKAKLAAVLIFRGAIVSSMPDNDDAAFLKRAIETRIISEMQLKAETLPFDPKNPKESKANIQSGLTPYIPIPPLTDLVANYLNMSPLDFHEMVVERSMLSTFGPTIE